MSEQTGTDALMAALVKVQPKLKHPHKNSKNPHLRNKFADLNSVIDANREVLSEAGLAVFQTIGGRVTESGNQVVSVTTIMAHATGQHIADTAEARVDEMKGLNLPQCMGVSITYLRRYGWQTILGLSGEDDSDGNEAVGGGGKPASKPAPDASDLL